MMNRPPMHQDPRLSRMPGQGYGHGQFQAPGQGFPQAGQPLEGYAPQGQAFGPQNQGFGRMPGQMNGQAPGQVMGQTPGQLPGQMPGHPGPDGYTQAAGFGQARQVDPAEIKNRMQSLAAQLPPAARQALAQIIQLLEADYAERHAGLEDERSQLQAAAETLAEQILGHAPGHVREQALAAGHPELSSAAHRKLAAATVHQARKLAAKEFAKSDPAYASVMRLMQEYVHGLPPQVAARLTDVLDHDPRAFLELYHQTRAQLGGPASGGRDLADARRVTKAPLLASAGADSMQPGGRQLKAAKLAARIKAGHGDLDDFADYLEASGVVDRITSASKR